MRRKMTLNAKAAPVGVVNSLWTSNAASGIPLRISAVAGAGTGYTPCAILILPLPVGW